MKKSTSPFVAMYVYLAGKEIPAPRKIMLIGNAIGKNEEEMEELWKESLDYASWQKAKALPMSGVNFTVDSPDLSGFDGFWIEVWDRWIAAAMLLVDV